MLYQVNLRNVQVEHHEVQQRPQRQQPYSASSCNRCNSNAPRHFRVTTAAANSCTTERAGGARFLTSRGRSKTAKGLVCVCFFFTHLFYQKFARTTSHCYDGTLMECLIGGVQHALAQKLNQ